MQLVDCISSHVSYTKFFIYIYAYVIVHNMLVNYLSNLCKIHVIRGNADVGTIKLYLRNFLSTNFCIQFKCK